MENSENLVRLKCFKVGKKLRVRIIESGYNHEANCQFPRAIREEGREYLVPREDISFAENARMKFFYRVKKKRIKIVGESELDLKDLKIYEDEEDVECCICMAKDKDSVFAPCGHYTCCNECAIKVKTSSGLCPMCRSKIEHVVGRDQIE